jgi:kynurenine 3-monooxygenase
MRKTLVRQGDLTEEREFVRWGYKEIRFPPGTADPRGCGNVSLKPHALHIWPRHDHFLMALANRDGSFTGTMYAEDESPLPDGTMRALSSAETFQSTSSAKAARAFWEYYYGSALTLLGEDGVQQYRDNPSGLLGNVRVNRYHVVGERSVCVLVGDAAHAVVPFFGQGVQCGFEDAYVLGETFRNETNLDAAAREYSTQRVKNCYALREMAMENMAEMGARVAEEKFQRRKELEQRIEAALPTKYRSRYALVCYTYNDYAAVLEAGKAQAAFLDDLLASGMTATEFDVGVVENKIDTELTPRFSELGVSLDCGTTA